jgi:hypothetical protein
VKKYNPSEGKEMTVPQKIAQWFGCLRYISLNKNWSKIFAFH